MVAPDTYDAVQLLDAQSLELYRSFEVYLKVERGMSPHSVRGYLHDVLAYLTWVHDCEDVQLLEPTHRQLRAYMGRLAQGGYAKSTINHHLSSIKAFYRWMVEAGINAHDPSSVMQGPKIPKHLPKRIPEQEMVAILSVHRQRAKELTRELANGVGKKEASKLRIALAKSLRNQAILELLYACGARVSEVSILTISAVDFPQCQVKVFGKGRKERIVPLHALALESLSTYLRDGRPMLSLRSKKETDLVFLSAKGRGYSTDAIRRMFAQTLAAAGVYAHYTPHDMRHTFASDLLEGGADLRSVQEMLGHASLSTTQIYTHLSPAHLLEVHHQAHPRG